MTVKNNRFTKSEKKELRKLTGLAYECEPVKALGALEESFKQWRNKKISAFELRDIIHKFHNGAVRNLWSFYETGIWRGASGMQSPKALF